MKHRTIEGIECKRCSTCKNWVNISGFNVQNSYWDGLQRECKSCRSKRYRNNREKILKIRGEYYRANTDKMKAYGAEHYRKNKQRYSEMHKQYLENNRDAMNEYKRKYYGNKYKTDINFRLQSCIRSRIYIAMKNNSKSKRTLELIGCSIDDYKKHLESQFDEHMNWDNYGSYWNIDHIIPCSLFNLSEEGQQLECFHYSNVRPLEVVKNIQKGNKML